MKKAMKSFCLLTAMVLLCAFSACSNNDDDSPAPAPTDDVMKISSGDSFELDGETYVVLTNTYNTSQSQSMVRSARAATVELSAAQKNLIDKYKEWVNVKQMLAQIGVTEYLSLVSEDSLNAGKISADSDKASRLPVQNTTGVISLGDSIYFYNKDKVKIAEFQMNWESSKMYAALTGVGSEVKDLPAIQWMEKALGVSEAQKTESLPFVRKTYTVDSDAYATFRASYEPNSFVVISFPENLNAADLYKKQSLQYTFKYAKIPEDATSMDDVTGLTIKLDSTLTDESFKERIKSCFNRLYYVKIGDVVKSTYCEYPEQKSGDETYSFNTFALCEYLTNMFYQAQKRVYPSGEKRIQLQATGKGEVKGDITEAVYKNQLTVYTNRGADSDVIRLVQNITGTAAAAITNPALTIRLKKNDYDSEKTLLNQTVAVFLNATASGTVAETCTLSEAIAKYLPHAIAFSTDTATINGYTLPKTLYARAKFPEKGHNKDYTVVALTATAAETDGFTYDLETPKTLQSLEEHVVPEFVYTFATHQDAIFGTMDYTGEETVFTAIDNAADLPDQDATSVNFAEKVIGDFTVASGATLTKQMKDVGGVSTYQDYYVLVGKATVNNVEIYGKSGTSMRLKVPGEANTGVKYVNFNGGSLDAFNETTRKSAGVAIPAVGASVTLSSVNSYVKVPCTSSKKLTFNAFTTAKTSQTQNHGTFIVTDADGAVLLSEKAVAISEDVANMEDTTVGAKDYTLDITGTVYILYCRPEGISSGGGSINSITLE